MAETMEVDVSNENQLIRLTNDISVEAIPTDIMRMAKGKERFQMHHSLAPSCPNICFAYCMKNSDKKDVIHYEHGASDSTLDAVIQREKEGETWLFETDMYGFHHLTPAGRKVIKGILQGVIDLVDQGYTHDNIANLKNIIIKRKDGYSKLKNMSNKKKGAVDLRGFTDVVSSLLKVKDDKLLHQLKIHLDYIILKYNTTSPSDGPKAERFLRASLKFLRKNHPVFKKHVGKLNYLLQIHRKKRHSETYWKRVKLLKLANHPNIIMNNAIPDALFLNSYDDNEKERWNPEDSSKWNNFSTMDVLDYFRNRVEHINDREYVATDRAKVGSKALYFKIHSLEPHLIGELYDVAFKQKTEFA